MVIAAEQEEEEIKTPFELRDYQIVGRDFLRNRKRAMLLDKAGMGKTAQATFAAEEPVIIFCPNYLVDHWVEWLSISCGFDAVAARGNKFARIKILQEKHAWTVCNVEMLGTLNDFFTKRSNTYWKTCIIDESHHLKSHKGIRAKTAVKLCQRIERVYELTASPIKREVDDLFMQLRILQPDVFSSYWRFVNQFCVVEDGYFGTQILGVKKSMLPDLHALLDICALGRDYEDVGRSLPPVIEKYVYVDLPYEVKKLYKNLVSNWRAEIEASEREGVEFTNYMEIMHSLRQLITGVLKADTIKQLYEDIEAQTQLDGLEDRFSKTTIASWYKNTARALAKVVPDCVALDGDVEVRERRKLALNSRNVSATISSLGEGIDLSTHRNLIFAEEDWTPGTNYQMLSRVLRERNNGEDNSEPVIVYYVHCRGTIDEQIHKLSKGRGNTAKQVIRDALYLS